MNIEVIEAEVQALNIWESIQAFPSKSSFNNDSCFNFADIYPQVLQVVDYFASCSVKPGDRICILLPTSREYIALMIGVLLVGCTYVPLDIRDKSKRIEYILNDCQARCCIVADDYDDKAINFDQVIKLTALFSKEVPSECNLRKVALIAKNPAYIIYTSGTTGHPKGVVVSNGSLSNYVNWAISYYGMKEANRNLLLTSLAYDMSVTVVFGALFSGGTIELVDGQSEDAWLLPFQSKEACYDLVKLTPSHLKVLKSQVNPASLHGKFKHVVIGGECLYGDGVQFWQKNAKETQFYNEYGPTEATVACSVYALPQIINDGELNTAVPIGQAISGCELYVLNEDRKVVPVGARGELYVGGQCLSLGYCNNVKETRHRFVEITIAGEQKQLYRTGDDVSYENGHLICWGRLDRQVNIRGYRVELMALESVAQFNTNITYAYARYYEENQAIIVLFVVPTSSAKDNDEAILKALESSLSMHLPAHAMPAKIICLNDVPLNLNGKVDETYLKQQYDMLKVSIDSQSMGASEPSVKQAIEQIWKEVLLVDDLHADSDFFDLGGHSLLAINLVDKVNQQFDTDMTINDVFDYSGLGAFVKQVTISIE